MIREIGCCILAAAVVADIENSHRWDGRSVVEDRWRLSSSAYASSSVLS